MMRMHHLQREPVAVPCACTALRKASRAVGRFYDSTLAGTGLNANQLSILRALSRTGPTPLSRLADAMVMDRTSLYRALGPMAQAGWVCIVTGPSGRAKLGSLTVEGRRVMDGAAERWEAAQSTFVEAVGLDEWRALNAMLGDVIATMASATGPATAHVGPAGEVRS